MIDDDLEAMVEAGALAERVAALRRRWPPGLVELHAELTAVEVLRRVGDLVDRTGASVEMRPLGDEALEWAAGGVEAFERPFFESRLDERAAARNLLWAAASWLEPDDVLMLVFLAALRAGWADVPARDLFDELLPEAPVELPASEGPSPTDPAGDV